MSDASLMTEGQASFPGADGPQVFSEFPIGPDVLEAVQGMGYEKPTPVQSAVVEAALAGSDLVVQAKTGSGKTSAFGIPIVEKLGAGAAKPGAPHALILAPTRELALQVANELRALSGKKGNKLLAVYGGVPMGRQIAGLKTGVDVVVGTPGRLHDHIRRGNLSLAEIKIVVLDEADEMLSMGFWDDVTDLLKKAPKERQTMLFSATLPYQVARAAAEYLKEPKRLDLSGDDLTVKGIANRIIHVLADQPKPRQLLYFLEVERPESAIIFCNTRNETEMMAKYLTQSGFGAEALTGNFKQKDRERVMGRIKSGELRYMVATDIAARGIDINDLSHVVNYSLPEFSEVYLHRVGRTGRLDKLGTAVSLVDGKGLGTLSVLEREFGIQFDEMKLPPEEEALRRRSERIMKELSEKASVAEVGQHLPVAQEILGSTDAAQVVAFLLKSHFSSQANESDRRRPSRASAPAGDAASGGPSEGSSRRNRRRRSRKRRRRPDGPSDHYSDNGNGYPVSDESVFVASSEEVKEGEEGTADRTSGFTRLRVNIGFEDGFKGRGSVAKKISALAGLNDGIVKEIETGRDHAILKASPDIAELVVERVDGAQLGKKIITVSVQN